MLWRMRQAPFKESVHAQRQKERDWPQANCYDRIGMATSLFVLELPGAATRPAAGDVADVARAVSPTFAATAAGRRLGWKASKLNLALLALACSLPGAAKAENQMLVLSPLAAPRLAETHAALALAPGVHYSPVLYSGHAATLAQLRTGSPPNLWECAWLVWNYADPDHFYYLALKPSGWELGKRDPAYPGGQRFLATGALASPVGSWRRFRIAQRGNEIKVALDGKPLVSFEDMVPPIYKFGRLGLYTEDARVALDDVTHPIMETFDALAPQSTVVDGASLGDWTLPFLGFGTASIAPRP